MKRIIISLIIAQSVMASQVLWEGHAPILAKPGDSVLCTAGQIEIKAKIHLPEQSTLFIKSKDGISFDSDAGIYSAAPGVHVVLQADADGSGQGQIHCTSAPCVQLTGDSSTFKSIESFENLSSAYQNLNSVQSLNFKSPSSEFLIQINSWIDLVKFAEVSSNQPTPIVRFGIALSKSLRANSLWTPLLGYKGSAFSGIIDGQHHTITGLKISNPNEQFQGFVGRASGAVIRDLGLDSALVAGGSHVGLFAGRLVNSRIDRCFGSGQVVGETSVGGLVGHSFASDLSDLHFEGKLRGLRHVGGIVGLIAGHSALARAWANVQISASEKMGALFGSAWEASQITSTYASNDFNTQMGDCLSPVCEVQFISDESMRKSYSFPNFDFKNIWILGSNSYPRLGGFDFYKSPKSKDESLSNIEDTNIVNAPFEFSVDGSKNCHANSPCHSSKELVK